MLKKKNNYTLKKIISEIIEIAEPGSGFEKASKIFDIFILTLILTNILAVVIGSISAIQLKYSNFLYYFEIVSVIIFSLEYILRLIVCTEHGKFKQLAQKENVFSNLIARLHYMVSPFAVIDILAILPFYLPMFITFDLRFIRILRLFRILRLLKAGRYTRSIKAIGRVIQQKKMELLTTFVTMFMMVLIASSLMFYVENQAQPEAFSSIPATMWWAVATLTTVGYGDVYPITILGKFFAGLIAVRSIGIVALPSGILASGLIEEFENLKEGIVGKGDHNNHVLICGWNYLGKEVIENLLSEDAKKAGIEQIVILADIDRPSQELEKHKNRNVDFIRANPLDESDLIIKGCVKTCHSILILPDLKSSKSDAETLMTLLAIKKINENTFVCVQLLDSNYKSHFNNAGANEVICLDDYGSGIAIGSIISHGLGKVISELITFNSGSEIYKTKKIPGNFEGKSFRELSMLLSDQNSILIAIETAEGEVLVNPNKNEKINPGSKLFIIAKDKLVVNKIF